MIIEAEPVAYAILRRHGLHKGDQHEDIWQDAREALVRAVLIYRPGAATWTTYAGEWVRHAALAEVDKRRSWKHGFHERCEPIDRLNDVAWIDLDGEPIDLELHTFVLTRAQHDVVDGALRGETTTETALRLGICLKTLHNRRDVAVQRLRLAHGLRPSERLLRRHERERQRTNVAQNARYWSRKAERLLLPTAG